MGQESSLSELDRLAAELRPTFSPRFKACAVPALTPRRAPRFTAWRGIPSPSVSCARSKR